MNPLQPALPSASEAIRATVASPSLVAALCLAGALAAFLIYPAYGQSGDEATAPSQPHRSNSGRRGHPELVISGPGRRFRHGVPDPAAASEGGRGHNAGTGGGHRFHGHHPRGRHGKRAWGPLPPTGSRRFAAARRAPGPTSPASTCPRKSIRRSQRRVPRPGTTPSDQGDAQAETCPDSAPAPTAVEVTAVPIVVESTTDDY